MIGNNFNALHREALDFDSLEHCENNDTFSEVMWEHIGFIFISKFLVYHAIIAIITVLYVRPSLRLLGL